MTGRFRTLAPTDTPVITDADRQFIEALGPAIRRQLWLRFTKPTNDSGGVIIQLDDLPLAPSPDAADDLITVMTMLAEEGQYTTVSPVFERRGGPEPTTRDREWMHAIHAAARSVGLALGLVLISHSRGVRAYAEHPDG